MPLVHDSPDAPPPLKPTVPQITTPQSRGVTVDTKYTPLASLITHLEGSQMFVEYYSQVLFADSAVHGQSINQIPEYQQYRLVKGFEFKVTSPFTASQDSASNAMIVTGSANIYSFLKPNVGDMFLADVGDGREGIFKVTHVERKTLYKETTHTIEYQLITYSADSNPWLEDLNSKVVETLYFVKDYLQYGQNPFLYEEEYVMQDKLNESLNRLTKVYFAEFTNREYSVLSIPGQSPAIYDHFLSQAVLGAFNTMDAPEVRLLRRLNVDDDQLMEATQIWKVIKEKDPVKLMTTAQRYGIVSTRLFTRNPMLEGIFHSGLPKVIYLRDPEMPLDYLYAKTQKMLSDDVLEPVPPHPRAGALMPVTTPPLIHDVLIDDYYVFSQNFYDKTELGQSKLELCVHDYLDSKAPNNPVLLELARTYPMWGGLERFYYGPALLMLIKASLRSR